MFQWVSLTHLNAFPAVFVKEAPANPPIICCRACNCIVGCETCIDTWYSGADGLRKCCPRCRDPRGYANTYQLKGIDDFLAQMKAFLNEGASDESLADTLPLEANENDL